MHCGWLMDGRGHSVRQNVLLEMDNGRFGRIIAAPTNSDPPGDAPVVDLTQCTVLPGLVDSHVHLTLSGTTDPASREHQLQADYSSAGRLIHRHLQDHFRHGVFAVRDGGDRGGYVLQYRQSGGEHAPVVVQTPGAAWHAQGRYGRLIGRAPAQGQTLQDAMAEAASQEGFPRRDHIKIVNSGLNSLREFGRLTSPQFAPDVLAAAIAAARRLGLGTMVHANGDAPVRESVAAGCDSIEHGFFMGKDNLDRMAEQRTVWVPTAATMSAYASVLETDSRERSVALKNLDHQLAQLAYARNAGVRVALGTDAGSPGVDHGRAVIEELRLLLAAGFTVPESVQCATRNGATLTGLKDSGCIVVGGRADCIAVAGSPDAWPENLLHIQKVYMDGALRYEAGTDGIMS